MKHSLILASQSPRRKELLCLAELNFTTHSADVDETLNLNCDLKEELKKLALKKARASEVYHPGCIVLGADTTVVLDNQILGKPKDAEDASILI